MASTNPTFKPGTMVDVMKYFGMSTGDFRKEWANLSDTDKDALKNGIGKLDVNGNATGVLTY